MNSLKDGLVGIFREEKLGFVMLLANLLLNMGLFVFAVANLRLNSVAMKVGYGDIGGYRDGDWRQMLVFPLAGVLFGVLHNLLAVRIFQKRGGAMMKFFVATTMLLAMTTVVVLLRLLKEN